MGIPNIDSEEIRNKKIKTSKRFAAFVEITVLIMLIVAYLSPSSIFVSTYIVIKSKPENVMSVLSKPQNFNLWNPWYGLDTAVIYNNMFDNKGTPNGVYWTSKNNADLSGNLKLVKSENPLRLKFVANFGRQGNGVFNFSANYTESGRTILRLDYYTEFGIHPINRLNGLIAPYWIKDDLQRAMKLLKKYIESCPEFMIEPNKIQPSAIDGDMMAKLNFHAN